MSGWRPVELGQVAAIERHTIEAEAIPPDMLYVGLENIERGGRIVNVTTAHESKIASTKFQFTSEQVLFGKLRPYLAKIARPTFNGVCSTDILPISPGGDLDRGYLAHFLAHPASVKRASIQATGANLPRLSPSSLANFPIPLPPLREQRRIAEVLDRVDALRAKRREAIARLDELAQSICLDMFGDPIANPKHWTRKPLGSLLERIESGSSPKCLARSVTDGEWGVLKLGAVTSCTYNPHENKALPAGTPYNSAYEIRPGDILFSRKNTPDLVAACVLVEETPPRLLMPDLVFRFRLTKNAPITGHYLQRLLTLPTKRRKVQELAGGSTASMSNISKARLANLLIELPPYDLQQLFSNQVSAIEELKRRAKREEQELDDLFASLQQRAFRGEL